MRLILAVFGIAVVLILAWAILWSLQPVSVYVGGMMTNSPSADNSRRRSRLSRQSR